MGKIENISNYGIAEGHVGMVKKFDNKDGSKKVILTLIPSGTFRSEEVKTCIRLQDFIPKNAESEGVWAFLEKGDFCRVIYEARNDDYKDKKGKWHYAMTLFITGIDILESKGAKEARKAATELKKEQTSGDEPLFN